VAAVVGVAGVAEGLWRVAVVAAAAVAEECGGWE